MKFKTIHLYCQFVQYKLKFVLFEQPFIIEKLRGFVKIHMKILSIYPLLSYRFIRSILWLISGSINKKIALITEVKSMKVRFTVSYKMRELHDGMIVS